MNYYREWKYNKLQSKHEKMLCKNRHGNWNKNKNKHHATCLMQAAPCCLHFGIKLDYKISIEGCSDSDSCFIRCFFFVWWMENISGHIINGNKLKANRWFCHCSNLKWLIIANTIQFDFDRVQWLFIHELIAFQSDWTCIWKILYTIHWFQLNISIWFVIAHCTACWASRIHFWRVIFCCNWTAISFQLNCHSVMKPHSIANFNWNFFYFCSEKCRWSFFIVAD